MASEENKILQGILKPLLKEAGYKKKGATWHHSSEHFIRVLNIQGSQWSSSFYLNLGIYIRGLGEDLTPTEYKCHVRERLDGIASNRIEASDLLDFTKSIEASDREEKIKVLISTYALPWLEGKSTIDGLSSYLTKEKKHGLPVSKDVWQYLDIDQPGANQSR